MTKSATILGGAAIATLIVAIAVTTIASGAAVPSSPEEQAATEALNRKIAEGNAAEEARAKAAQAEHEQKLKQYEEQKRAYDQKKAEYDAQLKMLKGGAP